MTDTTQTVGIAVIALALVRALETAIRALIEKKHNGIHGNHKSGDKSPEFWEMKFRAIVEREVEERVVPELKQIRDALAILIRRRGRD